GKEPPLGSAVSGALVEHLANMRHERNVAAQLVAKDLFAALQIAFGKGAARRRRPDVAARHLGKSQELQRLDEDEERLVLDMLALDEMRQVGATGIWGGADGVEQTHELLDRCSRQAIPDADRLGAGATTPRFASRHRRQDRIDLVDDLREARA